MTRRIAVLAFLLAAPTSARAQSWSDFASAFPLFPCQDGWMACLVDGQEVNPNMATQGGVPTPTTLRVDWFDLEPTSTFSPFVSLSQYTGREVGSAAVADAADVIEPEPVEPPPPPQPTAEEVAAQEASRKAAAEASRMEGERRAAEEASRKAAAEQEAQKKAAADAEKRKKELEAQAKAAANAAEAEKLRKQAEEEARKQKEAEEARKRAEAEAKKAEEERVAKAKAEEEARKKADEEAKKAAELKAQEDAKRAAEAQALAAKKAADEEAAKKLAAEEAAKKAAAGGGDGVAQGNVLTPPGGGAADAAPATCEVTELVKLEPQAMLGKLSLGQIKACENTLSTSSKMTDKEKISRVLMGNAYSKGDKAAWEQLVKRHLDEIDQSDPDICYKYALHLSQQGVGRATGVIRWANVALENRTVWTGDTYTARVYSLYKLRAAAANQLWQKAEADHAAAPTEDTRKKVDDTRNQTKVLAREWFEYAKAAGKDTTMPMQLCMSAAGTAAYCEGQ